MKRYFLLLSILIFICVSSVQSQWVRLAGLTNQNIYSVIKFNNKLFAALNPGGIQVSTNDGATWNSAANSGPVSGSNAWCLGNSGNNIFAGFMDSGIYTSTDAGATWTQTLVGASVWSFLNANNKIYANDVGTNGGIYVSTNDGLGWNQLNIFVSDKPTCLAQVGNNMFAGSFNGKLYISIDNGATWTLSNSGITNGKVTSIVNVGNKILASTYGWGVFISTDNGTTWTNPSGSSTYIQSFFVNGTNVIAGSGSGMGVSISYDGGTSWVYNNTGLTTLDVNYITLIGTDLYACTSNGIFKRPLQQILTSVEENKNSLPNSFSLEQNYPNPFNPSTVISYQLSAVSNVELKVYDILGREVATLVNEEKLPGRYTVRFDATNLSSGVYFYKLTAGNFVETKKLILIK